MFFFSPIGILLNTPYFVVLNLESLIISQKSACDDRMEMWEKHTHQTWPLTCRQTNVLSAWRLPTFEPWSRAPTVATDAHQTRLKRPTRKGQKADGKFNTVPASPSITETSGGFHDRPSTVNGTGSLPKPRSAGWWFTLMEITLNWWHSF